MYALHDEVFLGEVLGNFTWLCKGIAELKSLPLQLNIVIFNF